MSRRIQSHHPDFDDCYVIWSPRSPEYQLATLQGYIFEISLSWSNCHPCLEWIVMIQGDRQKLLICLWRALPRCPRALQASAPLGRLRVPPGSCSPWPHADTALQCQLIPALTWVTSHCHMSHWVSGGAEGALSDSLGPGARHRSGPGAGDGSDHWHH